VTFCAGADSAQKLLFMKITRNEFKILAECESALETTRVYSALVALAVETSLNEPDDPFLGLMLGRLDTLATELSETRTILQSSGGRSVVPKHSSTDCSSQ
jgi:hypothetical protein